MGERISHENVPICLCVRGMENKYFDEFWIMVMCNDEIGDTWKDKLMEK